MLAAYASDNWPQRRPGLNDLRDLSLDPVPAVMDTDHLIAQIETEIAHAMYKSAFPGRPQPDLTIIAANHHNVSSFSKVCIGIFNYFY